MMSINDNILQLNWNSGRYWMLSVDHIVVFSYPFPLVRFAQSQGAWLGIWWIRSGKGTAELDGEFITLSKGDMIFFTSEMKLIGEHDLTDPIELVGIRFSFFDEQGNEFFPEISLLPRGHYSYLPTLPFDQTVLQLLKYWRHSIEPQPIILHGIGLQIIGIACNYDRLQRQRNDPVFPKYKSKIARIIDIIQEQYDKPWKPEDLAREVNLTPSYMTKLFKRITGSTLKNYIVRTRLSAAESYLSDTNMLVGEVAEKCGYRDPYFFSRHFKRILGLTPSEYRQEITDRDLIREKLDRIHWTDR